MADNDRTFSEGEHFALLNDAVQRETASLTASAAEKDSKITELSNANDVLTTEKAAAVEAKEKAEKDLAEYKAEVEAQTAREALRTTRLAEVASASPTLDITEDTEDGKARVARILAMDDDTFAGYVADLKAVTPAQKADDKTSKAAPRESAALGTTGATDTQKPTVKGFLGAKRALTHQSA